VAEIQLPVGYEYISSTQQAFYFVSDIVGAEHGDWVIALNNNMVVGAREWSGEKVDIPVMGFDNEEYSIGYCELGETPEFALLKSNGEMINLFGNVSSWENNGISMVDILTTEDMSIPSVVTLSSAYPNPFNPSTQVSFSIPEDMDVSLTVYDMQGRIVETLVSGFSNKGTYDVQWDASNTSSGIYMITLETSSEAKTTKVVLVK